MAVDPVSPAQVSPDPRWSLALLIVPVALWSSLVFADTHFVDPDTYYHVGVARRLLEDGWVGTFEWLPHTTLHDPFPNMYLGQHILLMPVVAVFGPELGLRVGIVLLAGLFALSLALVLRRAGVRHAAAWTALGLLGAPVALSYALSIKGAATFLILLPWFVEAVWRADRPLAVSGWRRITGGPWRVFLLAWLSVYVYVGATVLIGFVLAHLLVSRLWPQGHSDGRWNLRPLAATLAGLAVGMTLHPSWPAQWEYVARELATIFSRDPNLIPGELRGAEWAVQPTDMLVTLCGLALVAWALAFFAALRSGLSAHRDTASAGLAAMGLLFGGLLSGTKLIHLFVVFSLLALPRLFSELAPMLGRVVLPRALLLSLGLAASTHAYLTLHAELQDPATRPRDYRAMGEWLDARTRPREMVLAPWDDMPGLFLFGRDQRFMAGFNVQFLKDADPTRFAAFVFFWRGGIDDPESTMIRFFDGARFVLLPRTPRSAGEMQLAQRLEHRREHFLELASPSQRWRVFARKVSP